MARWHQHSVALCTSVSKNHQTKPLFYISARCTVDAVVDFQKLIPSAQVLICELVINHFKLLCIKAHTESQQGKSHLNDCYSDCKLLIRMLLYGRISLRKYRELGFYKSQENTNRPLLLVALYKQGQRLLLN